MYVYIYTYHIISYYIYTQIHTTYTYMMRGATFHQRHGDWRLNSGVCRSTGQAARTDDTWLLLC